MKRQILSAPPTMDEKVISSFGIQRRNMLKFFGASAAVVAIGSSCNKDDNNVTPDNAVSLGAKGDGQILNYAYALEQLEAAFYIQVVASTGFGAIFTPNEQTLMGDIRDHEVAHREFFKTALGSSAIKGLTPDFSSVNFSNRASVLGTAKAFEDTGVTAYNGAAQFFTKTGAGLDYLTLAGKIVSVEARHAALIADLITVNTFSDTLDSANALDTAASMSSVVAIANSFLAVNSKISTNGLFN